MVWRFIPLKGFVNDSQGVYKQWLSFFLFFFRLYYPKRCSRPACGRYSPSPHISVAANISNFVMVTKRDIWFQISRILSSNGCTVPARGSLSKRQNKQWTYLLRKGCHFFLDSKINDKTTMKTPTKEETHSHKPIFTWQYQSVLMACSRSFTCCAFFSVYGVCFIVQYWQCEWCVSTHDSQIKSFSKNIYF